MHSFDRNAGAKKVRIADNTIHEDRNCFAVTGGDQVAKKTGADLVYPLPNLMRDMNRGASPECLARVHAA